MRELLLFAAALMLAACASFEGRGLVPGQSTRQEVEATMGQPAHVRRQPNGEAWLYYPRQPFGRQVFVARLGQDGRLIAVEPRLTDQTVARIQANQTTKEEVSNLLGPPYQLFQNPRQNREVWSWHMRRYGDPGIPSGLHVQFSPDGVAREVYLLDESEEDRLGRINPVF